MVRYAPAFLIIALLAAVVGFGGVAGELDLVGKGMFFIFTAMLVVSLIMGRRGSR